MGLVQVVVAYATTKETLKKRISGEAFEALMGAMYLDRGYEKTHRYIIEHVLKNYIDMERLILTETDFKSRLMEWGQKYKMQVEFETNEKVSEKPKGSKQFSAQVTIANVPIAKGSGKSKKEAEQMASQKNIDVYFNIVRRFLNRSIDALFGKDERQIKKRWQLNGILSNIRILLHRSH